MARFAENSVLSDTNVTKENLKDYVEGLKPQGDLVVTNELVISSNKIGLANNAARWVIYNKVFGDFSTAGTTSGDVSIVALGAGAIVHAAKIVTKTAFTGTSITAMNLSLGITASDPDDYINDQSIFTVTTTAGGEYTGTDFLTENAATTIICQAKSVGANLSVLTTGSVDVHVLWSISSSGL